MSVDVLKKIKISTPKGDVKAYDHLVDVVGTLIEKKPDKPYEYFESASTIVTEGKPVPSQRKPNILPSEEANRKVPGIDVDPDAELERAKEYLEIINPTKKKKQKVVEEGEEGEEAEPQEEEEEPEEEKNDGSYPNLPYELHLYRDAGVVLPEDEMYPLFINIKKLVEKNKLESVRFFGKFLGLKNDYYVVESVYKEDARPRPEYLPAEASGEEPPAEEEEKEEEEEAEGEAEGEKDKKKEQQTPPEEAELNAKTLVLASGSWTELPDITPQQVQASRTIKRYLTGDLDAEVAGYPPFPGKERHYLRSLISRIFAATSVAPAGFYKIQGEEEPEEGEEGGEQEEKPEISFKPPTEVQEIEPKTSFKVPDAKSLLRVDNWVHTAPIIIQEVGRCTMPPKEEEEQPEEEEEEEEEGEEGEKKKKKKEEPVYEPCPPVLHPVTSDKKIYEDSAWTAHIAVPENAKNRYTVLLRSNRWPGAFCLYSAQKSKSSSLLSNIYIGYGQKFETVAYNPVLPIPPSAEFTEYEPVENDEPSKEQEEEFKEPPPPEPEEKPEGEEGDEEEQKEDEEEES